MVTVFRGSSTRVVDTYISKYTGSLPLIKSLDILPVFLISVNVFSVHKYQNRNKLPC
jgi:hypothetical protein